MSMLQGRSEGKMLPVCAACFWVNGRQWSAFGRLDPLVFNFSVVCCGTADVSYCMEKWMNLTIKMVGLRSILFFSVECPDKTEALVSCLPVDLAHQASGEEGLPSERRRQEVPQDR